jgi:hypothetical protein
VPAASDQLLRDLRGARGWVFVPTAVDFAKITACVIDTWVSKVLGCHAAAYDAMPWGDTQVQSNNECGPTYGCLKHPDETPAVPAKRSRGRVKRILFGIPT